MQIPLLLDRSRPATLAVQIVEQLRGAILNGRIAPGTRMPSSRKLADQLDVSRNTVVRAYESLMIEAYVEARPASGMFATQRLPDHKAHPAPTPAIAPDPLGQSPMPLPYAPIRAQDLVPRSGNRLTFDFFPGRPSAGLFPLKTWRRLLQASLSHGGAMGLAQYSDPAGLAVLRTAIASHIAGARGIVADVNRIVVTGGVQEGINIAARLFLGAGTVGAIENPCYQGARFAFEAWGAEVLAVPVDSEGIMTDALPRTPTALIYVTPSHQYPTGHVLSLERRHALIAWARRTGCYILEDDYDGDFRYEGSPLPSIASLAPDCTIYLGTFSKSLGAGLRLGYVVVPAPLAGATRRAKALLNNGNSWLDQAALAEMIRSGSYASHLARIRTRYKESRDSLLLALRRQFGSAEISGAASGLHLFWRLPPGVPDAPVLEEVARRSRVGIYSLASGGAYDATDSELARRGVILGYAALLPRQIEQGIVRLSEAIDDALELPSKHLPAAPAASFHLAPRFAQTPALRPALPHRASFRSDDPAESRLSMPVVSDIYRYPIKGLSPQRLTEAVLQAGQPFPQDRLFALARPRSPIDTHVAKWACRVADKSRDGPQPGGTVGLRDRPPALSRQHLHRRRQALGRVRLDRPRYRHRPHGVPRRSPQRPVRRDQRKSRERPARSRHPGLAAHGVRPQGSRRLPGDAQDRRGERRRAGDGAATDGTGPRAAVRPARPCDAGAALHLPWLLLHLRGAIRPAAAGRAARNGLRRAPRLLSVPRLRH